jgi:DNA polymerase V
MALIALVDCNNFYATCERVFQPHLRGRPLVVLSNNDGCVIARSQEAKDMGIEMGVPWHVHQQNFERQGVAVRSSNYTLYGDMSARVMSILQQHTNRLEVYSIDEAFLELGDDGAGAEHIARHIKDIVREWTGIDVSIGIGPSKTLAKAANRYAKRMATTQGVYALNDATDQQALLGTLALEDVWGIAFRLAQRLRALGIATPLDLRQADPAFVRARCGVVVERLVYELRGQPCLGLDDIQHERKSLVASRSFGKPIEHYRDMREAVVSYTSRVAEKMRHFNLAASHIIVFIETNRFNKNQAQYRASQNIDLPVATADTGRLAQAAVRALNQIWRHNYSYKKAGVMLLGLCPAGRVEDGLFDRADDAPSRARMKAIDAINQRYGRNTIRLASLGAQPQWCLRRQFLSPSFTTHWDDLVQVR